MPSNEDKNRNGNAESDSLGIDALTELSAEEIEKLLAEGAGTRPEEPEDVPQGDVLDMLEEAGDHEDDDLLDIQDMLKKSDRNEAIDAGAEEETGSRQGPADRLLADIEGAEESVAPPADAKARKAEKKARKAQEKAEKAARRKAEKEAAKAGKAAKRGKKRGGKDSEPSETKAEGSGEIEEFDMLLDRDLLDSIVSDAGNVGRGEERESAGKPGGFSVNELGKEYDAAREREKAPEAERMKEEDVAPVKEKTAESDIMELDMDEIDAFIPDISSGPQEEAGAKRKGGFMSKIITMLTEEEPENEDIPMSEENQEILKDLDKEKAGGKKAKKAKKPAKKKEKKKKAPKPAKPAKPKKPKKEKEPEPYTGKKLTFKKSLPILLLGATVGAVVFIFVNLATDYSVKQEAAEAFSNGDYQTCYQNLYGKKLDEEQARMYGKAESILYMEQECRKYEIVLKNGTELQAVDSLLRTVADFPAVQEYAAQCEALPEVEQLYAGILGILSDKYGITEEQAKEIAALGSRIEYTRAVTALAEGKGYGSGSTPAVPQQPEGDSSDAGEAEGQPGGAPEDGADAIVDELPEEAELGEENFAD